MKESSLSERERENNTEIERINLIKYNKQVTDEKDLDFFIVNLNCFLFSCNIVLFLLTIDMNTCIHLDSLGKNLTGADRLYINYGFRLVNGLFINLK
jgi:hypothetical protein